MADAKREPTTTLPLPVSKPGTSVNPLYNKSLFAPLPTSPARPQLSSIAHAGLNVPTKSLQYKHTMSPKFQAPPLTGAAALEENRRHEKELEKRVLPGTSPNPAKVAVMGIMAQPMSKPTDAPPATPRAQAPLPVITTEPPPNEMVRDVSMTVATVASPVEMTTPIDRPANNLTPNPRKRPASPRVDDRATKAMTFPPLQSSEELSPRARRDMTFPAQSSSQGIGRSPQSSKKHKCPHCSTEFTRHHNLKSHLLTHSQEKPYGCQQCVSRFRRLHDLKRHIKLHTGEKSHVCSKCGRKFARGDALARHNRGPGGCAGRRGSAGEGDDYGDEDTSELGQSMEGVQYHGDGGREQYGEDDNYADDTRRRSEPDRARSDTMNSATSTTSGTYHHHSSTYPGLAPMSRALQAYPPATLPPPNTAASPKDAPKHLSPKPPFSTVQYSNNISPYPQANITDSPKPLSPGQPDPSRTGYSNPRLPSRSHGEQSMFGNLPPPTSQGTPLPSLSADPRFSQSSPGGQPPSLYSGPHNPIGQSFSHSGVSGSSSSHHQSSGGSLREAFAIDTVRSTQTPVETGWDTVHSNEKRLNDALEKMRQQEERYELEISRLKEEVTMLKAQLGPSQSQR